MLQAKGTLLKDIASWLEGTDDALENCMTGGITLLPNLTNGDGEMIFPVAPGMNGSQNSPTLGLDFANPSAPGN